MNAEEFKAAFETEITVKYHGVWTLFAETKRGNIPVCFVLAFWCHPEPQLAPYMILDQLVWLPWSTPRNRIESATNFFNSTRNDIPMIGYARERDKKFFEVMMKHGIMRRIGTSFNVFPDEPAAVYETRKP